MYRVNKFPYYTTNFDTQTMFLSNDKEHVMSIFHQLLPTNQTLNTESSHSAAAMLHAINFPN